MSDNRKYYYLKLKENYFDDDSIVLLESMQDGVLYSNILLKLYLKSLKHGGRLQLDEDIPYTAQMIATITRQQIGTVERALQIFLKLGLVEVLDSGTFYMSNIELLIGQSSTEAERKRAARLQNKALSAPRTNGGHLSDIHPPEIEIEKEIYNNICSPEAVERENLNQKEPDERESDFEKIYAIYPKKRGRTKAFANYCSWLKGRSVNGKRRKLTNREMYLAVHAYVEQQKEHETELEYYKNFDTLMGSQLLDYVEVEQNE